MEVQQYADGAAALVNAALPDAEAVQRHLAGRRDLAAQASDRDAFILRRFAAELRPVFEADSPALTVRLLNSLLARHPITPYISDHLPGRYHLHAAGGATPAEVLRSEALLGLTMLVCELGPSRLGACQSDACRNVYVDTSPNQSRRYCSSRCSSRANVAAYRARQRTASTG